MYIGLMDTSRWTLAFHGGAPEGEARAFIAKRRCGSALSATGCSAIVCNPKQATLFP